jgi:hypothetical protein
MQLGQTNDPTELVPGDPREIYAIEARLIEYGDLLHEAGAGLGRIDTTAGWSGAAADAFHNVFHGQPGKWVQAGDAFHAAANALDSYACVLTWAQGKAADAISMWRTGTDHHQAAQDTLASAISQTDSAGQSAADAVGAARDLAPPKPSLWSRLTSDVASDFHTVVSGTVHMAEQFADEAASAAASLGNAALHDPGALAQTAAGLILTTLSAGGEAAGFVLDASGVGAIAGVPLDAVSAAGIAAGIGLTARGTITLVQDAVGPDRVEMGSNSGGGGGPGAGTSAPKSKQEITQQAGDLGYTRRISPQKAPFNSHGQPVYTDGDDYITPDVDGHNVSDGWKLFNRRGVRIGTYSWDLTRIKD